MLKLSEIIISGIKSFDTLSASTCLSTFPPWTCSNGYADIIIINCSSKTTGLTGVLFVAVFSLFISRCNCWNLPVVIARFALLQSHQDKQFPSSH